MICLALAGGAPDMPDLPDMMSGNLKRMTVQDGRPGPPMQQHPPRMEAAGRAESPKKPAAKGKHGSGVCYWGAGNLRDFEGKNGN